MACAAAGVLALWPAHLEAQRRAGRVHVVRPPVFVSAHDYRPFYPAYWQRYPYGYPYRYAYRYDYRSSLRIRNTPREAEVFVNGYFVGLVDDFDGWAQRLYLEPGEHEIAIHLEGFRTRRTLMLFRPGQSYRLALGLEPLGPGEAPEPRPMPSGAPARDESARRASGQALGSLSLRIQPADADVFIDGERWEWPAGSDRLVVDVPEGTRRIEVRRQGHQAYETTVTVKRGETTALNISLPR